MLILTNKPLQQFSTCFSLVPLSGGAKFGTLGSTFTFVELLLAIFFLNDRIGGHPTTGAGAGAVLLYDYRSTIIRN